MRSIFHILIAFFVAITVIGIIYLIWCHMFQQIEEAAPISEA